MFEFIVVDLYEYPTWQDVSVNVRPLVVQPQRLAFKSNEANIYDRVLEKLSLPNNAIVVFSRGLTYGGPSFDSYEVI